MVKFEISITRRHLLALASLVAAVALIVPTAGWAADKFKDVPDSNIFHDDVAWLADAGVTKGCNPPANDEFCPGDNVRRETMAAFMHRLAVNQVVDAATAIEADHAADADELDGMNSTEFMQHEMITTTVGGTAWLPYFDEPTTMTRTGNGIIVSGDGSMVLPINAPAVIGGDGYSLHTFEICIDVSGGGYVTGVLSTRTNGATDSEQIFADATDRTTDGCYAYTVDKSLGKGAGLFMQLLGGGTVRINGTTFTWTQDGG